MPKLPENFQIVKQFIDAAENGKQDPIAVGRVAAAAGLLMIGCTESQEVHYPVPAEEHSYYDLYDGGKRKCFIKAGTKALRATGVSRVAAICAVLGDFNSQQQRWDRANPYFDGPRENGDFGWTANPFITADYLSRPMRVAVERLGQKIIYLLRVSKLEHGAVSLHARPELINAARDPDNPLKGYIDFIDARDLTDWERVPHETGSWVTPNPKKTVFSMAVSGLDLPTDIMPSKGEAPRIIMR